MTIQQQDAIIGEIYLWHKDYYVRISNEGHCNEYIHNKDIDKRGGGCSGELEEISQKEKDWFNHCIEHGYTPLETFKYESYEIY